MKGLRYGAANKNVVIGSVDVRNGLRVIIGVGTSMGKGGATSSIFLVFLFMEFQCLIGPSMVSLMMRAQWVSEKGGPELHHQGAESAQRARISKPKVGISQISIPNVFAFGRTQSDGRVCVTQGE
jgi:heat shock protein HtpX